MCPRSSPRQSQGRSLPHAGSRAVNAAGSGLEAGGPLDRACSADPGRRGRCCFLQKTVKRHLRREKDSFDWPWRVQRKPDLMSRRAPHFTLARAITLLRACCWLRRTRALWPRAANRRGARGGSRVRVPVTASPPPRTGPLTRLRGGATRCVHSRPPVRPGPVCSLGPGCSGQKGTRKRGGKGSDFCKPWETSVLLTGV